MEGINTNNVFKPRRINKRIAVASKLLDEHIKVDEKTKTVTIDKAPVYVDCLLIKRNYPGYFINLYGVLSLPVSVLIKKFEEYEQPIYI
jgi:hypothetical protein